MPVPRDTMVPLSVVMVCVVERERRPVVPTGVMEFTTFSTVPSMSGSSVMVPAVHRPTGLGQFSAVMESVKRALTVWQR